MWIWMSCIEQNTVKYCITDFFTIFIWHEMKMLLYRPVLFQSVSVQLHLVFINSHEVWIRPAAVQEVSVWRLKVQHSQEGDSADLSPLGVSSGGPHRSSEPEPGPGPGPGSITSCNRTPRFELQDIPADPSRHRGEKLIDKNTVITVVPISTALSRQTDWQLELLQVK